MQHITLNVNKREYKIDVPDDETLLNVLREYLGLTGTKVGCNEGECGACTVLMDGIPVMSCLVLACEAEGYKITTIEGLEDTDLQEAFIEHQAFQCGFCTPGMLMNLAGFLNKNPEPTEEEIREALVGNLCRCTGYIPVFSAVKEVVKRRKNR